MHFKNYLNSFKVKKTFWYTLTVDFIFFVIFTLIFATFGAYVQRKSYSLTGGKSPAEIQQLMLASPEQAAVFLTQIKSFLSFVIIGAIILITVSLLLYSLSRALIWYKLNGKKLTKKNYWRWNALNLALIFPLFIFAIAFLIIKLLMSLLLEFFLTFNLQFYYANTTFVEFTTTIFNGLVSFFLSLFIIIFILLFYYSYTHKNKVWVSIGSAFGLFKKKWKQIWVILLFGLLTGVVLTLITYPLKQLLIYNPIISTILQLIIGLLFINWLRLYLFKTISHEH